MKHASNGEVLMFKKPLDARLHQLLTYTPELNLATLTELEFISNFQAIQVGKKPIWVCQVKARIWKRKQTTAPHQQTSERSKPSSGHSSTNTDYRADLAAYVKPANREHHG